MQFTCVYFCSKAIYPAALKKTALSGAFFGAECFFSKETPNGSQRRLLACVPDRVRGSVLSVRTCRVSGGGPCFVSEYLDVYRCACCLGPGGFEGLRVQAFCLGVFGLLFQKVLGVGLDLTLHSFW